MAIRRTEAIVIQNKLCTPAAAAEKVLRCTTYLLSNEM